MSDLQNKDQRVIIIGAGPAGLTAAFEFQKKSKIKPVIFERSDYIGGISRTVNYKGNRMDIGGHRFFSKSDRVMNWWLDVMPMQSIPEGEHLLGYQGKTSTISGSQEGGLDPEKTDKVMLMRNRKSRIYFMRKFFDYPISLSLVTIQNLGLWSMAKIGVSYMKSCAMPIKPERTLEQFFINRFGSELYKTFFQSYTEKVWGVPCAKISASWGAQRIKGLSLLKTVTNLFSKVFASKDIRQKNVETSLIERFLYPKLGPGQMWECVAEQVQQQGGELHMHRLAVGIKTEGKLIKSITFKDPRTGEEETVSGDYFISTMPIQDLVRAMGDIVPPDIKEISEGLVYRDFITVGLLVNKLKIQDLTDGGRREISDNWIYIQEPDVKIGRLQVFNNWSPYLVADPTKTWLGLEYFCNEKDDIWSWDEDKMAKFAVEELAKINIIDASEVIDHTVIKVDKTYPGYFGSYDRFDTLRLWLDQFTNLYLVGRNGMHKYNNQDHSMLSAMTAVENIIEGKVDKENIWAINAEELYHEDKGAK